jgi:hypothetical protein
MIKKKHASRKSACTSAHASSIYLTRAKPESGSSYNISMADKTQAAELVNLPMSGETASNVGVGSGTDDGLSEKGRGLLNHGLHAGNMLFGPFHRIESTTQTSEVATIQQASGEAWGRARRGTYTVSSHNR